MLLVSGQNNRIHITMGCAKWRYGRYFRYWFIARLSL